MPNIFAKVGLSQFRGFAAETLPANRLACITRRLAPPRNMELATRAIMASHETMIEYGVFGFGKWIHHEAQVKRLMQGAPYEVTPITAEFVPTLECNFTCARCTYRDWKGLTTTQKGKRYMDLALMKHLLDELKKAGLKGIIWTGGGEPTLHPNLLEGMRYAKSLGLKNGLFSNGSHLTPEMVETLLLEIAPAFIRISVNAPTEESHRRFHSYSRAEDYFGNILDVLTKMAQMKMHDRRISTTIGIGVLVSPRNLSALREFGSFIRQILFTDRTQSGWLDYIAFRPEVMYGGEEVAQHSPEFFARAEKNWGGLVLPSMSGPQGLDPIFIRERFRNMNDPQQADTPYCLAHPWRVSIAYDGKVYLCAEQNGNPNFCLGDLSRQSFAEIWYGKQRKSVIRDLNAGMYQKLCPPICVLTYMSHVFNQLPFPLSEKEAEAIEKAIASLRGQAHPHVEFL